MPRVSLSFGSPWLGHLLGSGRSRHPYDRLCYTSHAHLRQAQLQGGLGARLLIWRPRLETAFSHLRHLEFRCVHACLHGSGLLTVGVSATLIAAFVATCTKMLIALYAHGIVDQGGYRIG